ncbi:MAG: histidinol-phosphate transaminase [Chloroflexi bacterium]|nr:histidinol-phosphate transaminase [Chloroflexota bacterium]
MSATPEIRRSAVRRAIAEIAPYAGPDDPEHLAKRLGRPVESIIKLDANENPYGPSPLVQEFLSTFNGYSVYPDADQRTARDAVAEYAGVPASSIILGNGADELIDLLMRAYLDPGDELMDFPPSFAMYAFNAQLQDARVVAVPRDEQFNIDVDAAIAAITDRTKIILLTSPNNPTGTVMPTSDVRRLLDTGYLVVLDEAYYEFANADGQGFETMIGEVANYPNLVVLRTFSKWAGLAGLRIGYGVFPQEVSQHLWKLKPPFNVNVAALVAMRAALADRAHLMDTVQKIVAERERLLVELPRTRIVTPHPTRSNFILADVHGMDGRELRDRMADEGILLRHYGSPRLKNCIRISVGRPEQNDVVLATLKKLADERGL